MATKYSYLRMEPADNGVIVSWDEQTESLLRQDRLIPTQRTKAENTYSTTRKVKTGRTME